MLAEFCATLSTMSNSTHSLLQQSSLRSDLPPLTTSQIDQNPLNLQKHAVSYIKEFGAEQRQISNVDLHAMMRSVHVKNSVLFLKSKLPSAQHLFYLNV